MALKFIRKSCEYCDSFSFILAKSFKKNSLQVKIPIYFHLIFQADLPNNSFYINNEEHLYNVPCVYQIWIKQEKPREIPVKLIARKFCFVSKGDKPDISVRRVGINAGYIDRETDKKSQQSHYFIKFINSEKSINKNIKKLSIVKFEFNNSVGPRSISKQELIAKYYRGYFL